MIKYVKDDLFNAPRGQVIVHSCNSMGVWGSGIAKTFKEKYPESFSLYQLHCNNGDVTGQSMVSQFYPKQGHHVGWLITSMSYGKNKDSIETILINTSLSVNDLCKKLLTVFPLNSNINVNSNKINSGLFCVPWGKTEFVIETVLKKHPKIVWSVYDPDLKA